MFRNVLMERIIFRIKRNLIRFVGDDLRVLCVMVMKKFFFEEFFIVFCGKNVGFVVVLLVFCR